MPDKENLRNERDEELERFLHEAEDNVEFPGKKKADFTSREYNTFMEEEESQKKAGIYEKICNLVERAVEIEPGEDKKAELQRAIDFAYLQITPTGAYSFAILSGLSVVVFSFLLLALGIIGYVFTLVVAALGAAGIYMLIQYPISKARLFRIKASNEIVLAIIYIVIYMRSAPNLEGAIRFAARHLRGPLSLDFKKLLWDIETKKYYSIKAALSDYMDKWEENRSFVEAMQIIQNSMEQGQESRESMLDEAVKEIMVGSRQKMKKYSNSLEMPIMIIHALGIMLPIMVLVMFPMVMLVLKETVKPMFLFIGYDVILPLIIYSTGRWTLQYRPAGFSAPDISLHPDYEPTGKMNLFGKTIPVWPISIVLSATIIIIGYFLNTNFNSTMLQKLATSAVVTIGMATGPASYFYLDTRKKLDIRKRVKDMEEEFSEALFTFGNRLSLGEPVEKAMKSTVEKNRELKISEMFLNAVRNMREGGMNLRDSLFDKKFGAVWEYPSKLIISVVRVVIRSSEKGFKIASMTAVSISKYIKKMKQVEEDLKDMLSSETTSMQFLGAFLGPLVAGISVSMASMMMTVFKELGKSLEKLETGGGMTGGMGMNDMMLTGWGSAMKVISVSWLQIIVGIYVIQTSYLLAMLTSGIESGPGDKIARRYHAGITIFIGVIVYSLTMLVVWTIFGSQLKGIFEGVIA